MDCIGLLDGDSRIGLTCKTDPRLNADFDPKESWDENSLTEPGRNKMIDSSTIIF